jgi:hypothetical protein
MQVQQQQHFIFKEKEKKNLSVQRVGGYHAAARRWRQLLIKKKRKEKKTDRRIYTQQRTNIFLYIYIYKRRDRKEVAIRRPPFSLSIVYIFDGVFFLSRQSSSVSLSLVPE